MVHPEVILKYQVRLSLPILQQEEGEPVVIPVDLVVKMEDLVEEEEEEVPVVELETLLLSVLLKEIPVVLVVPVIIVWAAEVEAQALQVLILDPLHLTMVMVAMAMLHQSQVPLSLVQVAEEAVETEELVQPQLVELVVVVTEDGALLPVPVLQLHQEQPTLVVEVVDREISLLPQDLVVQAQLS
jgi:hypothetical protein